MSEVLEEAPVEKILNTGEQKGTASWALINAGVEAHILFLTKEKRVEADKTVTSSHRAGVKSSPSPR